MTGRSPRLDPRAYQITILSALLAYGVAALAFELRPAQILTILAWALGTQAVCTRLWRRPHFDPRSALISALSLCLLLRTNDLWIDAAAAVLAISSKFVVTSGASAPPGATARKHIFNPTNIALVALVAATNRAWVSPGQWGTGVVFAFSIACAGGLVVNRATRSDVTYAFLAIYLSLVFGRSFWLGEPFVIPLHRVANGALLLFAFFMVSDPRTTPDSRIGRMLFATLVAVGAYDVQFRLFRTNGLLWSLAACSLLVPLIDRLLPARRFSWPTWPDLSLTPAASRSGGFHEVGTPLARARRVSRPRLVG